MRQYIFYAAELLNMPEKSEMSLHETSRQKEKQNLDSMTREERMFYNRLLEVMTQWRSEIVNRIFKREKPPVVLQEEDKLSEILPMEKTCILDTGSITGFLK